MKKLKLTRLTAIIIGVVIAVPLLIFGFLTYFGVFSRASSEAPTDLLITKITQQSATVTWTTDQETQGTIEYGTSSTQLTFFAPEATKTQQHSVDLTLLTPGTTHFFVIRIGDQVYDNAGVPWNFTTKADKPKEATLSAELSPASPEAGVSPEVPPSDEPSPTGKKTSATAAPASVKPTLKSSTPTPTPKPSSGGSSGGTAVSCSSTDCDAILGYLGPGKCSVSDYQRCRGKTITPTITPAISNTPTRTPTPTGEMVQTPYSVQVRANSATDVLVYWEDHSDNEDGFEIQRASFAATLTWSVVKTIAGASGNNNPLSWTDTGSDLPNASLGSGYTYKYRVRGFVSDGSNVYYSNYGPTDKGYQVTIP
jgi:hypothetical protein